MAMAAMVIRSGLVASREDGGVDSAVASFEVLAAMRWIVALSLAGWGESRGAVKGTTDKGEA
jgi:hypothetical protein